MSKPDRPVGIRNTEWLQLAAHNVSIPTLENVKTRL